MQRHNNMGLIGNNEPVNARIKLNELLILHFVIVSASTVYKETISAVADRNRDLSHQ